MLLGYEYQYSNPAKSLPVLDGHLSPTETEIPRAHPMRQNIGPQVILNQTPEILNYPVPSDWACKKSRLWNREDN